MDLRRVHAGELIAALGGVVLFLSLFAPWYDHGTPAGELLRSGSGRGAWNAWQSFAALDVLLALIAAAAVALLVVTAVQSVPAVPVATAALVTLAGVVAVVLIVLRLIFEPGLPGDVVAAPAGAEVDTTKEVGPWLALLAALTIVAGAALAMRDERRAEAREPGAGESRMETIPAPGP